MYRLGRCYVCWVESMIGNDALAPADVRLNGDVCVCREKGIDWLAVAFPLDGVLGSR